MLKKIWFDFFPKARNIVNCGVLLVESSGTTWRRNMIQFVSVKMVIHLIWTTMHWLLTLISTRYTMKFQSKLSRLELKLHFLLLYGCISTQILLKMSSATVAKLLMTLKYLNLFSLSTSSESNQARREISTLVTSCSSMKMERFHRELLRSGPNTAPSWV